MRIFIFLSGICLTVCSCNYRIYINGRHDHNERGLTKKWHTTNTKCILLSKNDTIPEGAIFMNNTEIRSPFIWLTTHSYYDIMGNELKTQAQKVHANVIQVNNMHSTKFSRLHVKTKMYSLQGAALEKYQYTIDSVKNYNKNFCVIHIKNLAQLSGDSINLMFNDSLLTEISNALPGWGNVFKQLSASQAKENVFYLNNSGILTAQEMQKGKINTSASANAIIRLEKGNEYYLYIIWAERFHLPNDNYNTQYLKFVIYNNNTDVSSY